MELANNRYSDWQQCGPPVLIHACCNVLQQVENKKNIAVAGKKTKLGDGLHVEAHARVDFDYS
jgi:hypothetical protein